MQSDGPVKHWPKPLDVEKSKCYIRPRTASPVPSARRRRSIPNSNQYAILSPSSGAASLSQLLNFSLPYMITSLPL
ncbi:hypothetical protein EMIT047CA2_230045 [Pseudomonas soli]